MYLFYIFYTLKRLREVNQRISRFHAFKHEPLGFKTRQRYHPPFEVNMTQGAQPYVEISEYLNLYLLEISFFIVQFINFEITTIRHHVEIGNLSRSVLPFHLQVEKRRYNNCSQNRSILHIHCEFGKCYFSDFVFQFINSFVETILLIL